MQMSGGLKNRKILKSPTLRAFSVVLGLGHAEPVAEGIFDNCYHAVELIFGFGDELYALALEFLIGLAAIGSVECSAAEPSFFHERGYGFSVFLRTLVSDALLFAEVAAAANFHQTDFKISLSFGRNGEPAKAVWHCLINLYFKAEFAGVEVFGDILVEDVDYCVRHFLDHEDSPW